MARSTAALEYASGCTDGATEIAGRWFKAGGVWIHELSSVALRPRHRVPNTHPHENRNLQNLPHIMAVVS